MKKTFDSFTPCLELREVIFLRTLPKPCTSCTSTRHLPRPLQQEATHRYGVHGWQFVPAYEGSGPQVHGSSKCEKAFYIRSSLDLDHIHAHQFFHRDIKPENILVSTSAPHDSHSTFSRYSALVTPTFDSTDLFDKDCRLWSCTREHIRN